MTTNQTSDASPPRPRWPRPWLALAAFLVVIASGVGLWFAWPPSGEQQKLTYPDVDQTPEDFDPPPIGSPWFRDMTKEAGVNFTYRNGEEAGLFAVIEEFGGGIALIDYDGDGLLDIFIAGGGTFEGADKKTIKGQPCKLYKNLGGFKFQDVTREAGLDQPWWYTHGVAVADYDCDGWPDLLVTGFGKMALYHNEPDDKGGRHFVDVTAKVGLKSDLLCMGAGWSDLHGDGFPDLYVCHHADWSLENNPPCTGQLPGIKRDRCPPTRFNPQRHALWRNDKGNRFRDVSAELGFKAEGYGLGVILADLNGDGRPDIYVANDMTDNVLYLNRGKGKLEEAGVRAGVALDDTGRATASMGVDAADFDGSGQASLIVTTFQRELPSLYRNLGKEVFAYDSWAAGFARLFGNRLNVGWGTGFVDVDNDGWPDLVMVNGHLFLQPAGSTLKQKALLLRNVDKGGRRVFEKASRRGGPFFDTAAVSRGLAIGDLDNDGWPDLVVSNMNSPVVLLRNQAALDHPKHHWLGIRLVGKKHRDVVGSVATLQLDGASRTLTRFAKGGGSYLSACDQRLLFGLGESGKICRLTVKWSWGETQSWDNLQPDRYYELHEGEAAAKPMKAAAR